MSSKINIHKTGKTTVEMADIFTMNDARKLLKNKRLVFFGDSNTRAVYKDLVRLLTSNKLLSLQHLRNKLEPSFLGDLLVKSSALTRGRNYEEQRQLEIKNINIEFYFITSTCNKTIEDVVKSIKNATHPPPDLIVMNSCLWDLTRWGPDGVLKYKENLVKAMKLFKKYLPPETLFVWTTTLPISKNCYGGFLIKQVEFLKHTLRFDVMEANMFARDVVTSYGYDILDLHYYFMMQINRRDKDGIHWMPDAVRFMTNLILTHVALSWGHTLPGNISNSLLDKVKHMDEVPEQQIGLPAETSFSTEVVHSCGSADRTHNTAPVLKRSLVEETGSSEDYTSAIKRKPILAPHPEQEICWFDTSNIPNPQHHEDELIACIKKEIKLFLVKRRLGPRQND